MILARVISGGQSGVDLAGVRVAKSLGIPTGGTMPKGWTTLDGSRPEYAELYGMVESDKCGYEDRTLQNVRNADFTLRIARWFNSAGERRTKTCIKQVHGKLYVARYDDVTVLPNLTIPLAAGTVSRLATRLSNLRDILGRPVVLNIAGNSENTCRGIGAAVEPFLKLLFEECLRRA